jgi:hypothetical protein
MTEEHEKKHMTRKDETTFQHLLALQPSAGGRHSPLEAKCIRFHLDGQRHRFGIVILTQEEARGVKGEDNQMNYIEPDQFVIVRAGREGVSAKGGGGAREERTMRCAEGGRE